MVIPDLYQANVFDMRRIKGRAKKCRANGNEDYNHH